MFSQEVADAICLRVAEGASLRTACAEIGAKVPTFLLWCSKDKELAEQYARARETGTDAEFEDLDELQSQEPPTDANGKVDQGWVAWRRLQVDTKKWALSKKAPKKYGDKLDIDAKVAASVVIQATPQDEAL